MYTTEFLAELFPRTNAERLESFVEPLNTTAARFGIDENASRAAAFIAQVGHESGGLNFLQENLKYSAQALLRVFPKYFTPQLAAEYAYKPEKIASRVYGNRMGNGPEESGDGWTYRGRGIIQLTGRNNYTRFAADMGMTLEEAVEYLETVDGAVMSAGWFWDVNKLNAIADDEDIVLLTKRINGGKIGLQEREELFYHALNLIE